MKIELLTYDVSKLEAMSEAELTAILSKHFNVTRPDKTPKHHLSSKKTKPASPKQTEIALANAVAIANKHGVDMSALLRKGK